MLETTRGEAQQILEEARKQAKEEEKEIIAGAHKESEAIIEKGKAEAERARSEMEKGVKKSAIDLAAAMTKRLLTGVLTNEEKHKLISKHIKELESMHVS